MKVLQLTCNAANGPTRADRAVQQLTGLSRAAVRGLFDHNCVTINNAPCTASQTTLSPGDHLQIRYNPHQRYKELPKTKPDPAFDLLYEDDDLLVVNKAPHVFTVPTATDKGKTLIDALENYIKRPGSKTKSAQATNPRTNPRSKNPRARNSANSKSTPQKLHIIQRLDRGVSGVLVVAKNAKAAQTIRDQFASHKPQRIYIAIVSGALEQSAGTFRSHMLTGPTLNRYSTKTPGLGELAVTHYEVINSPLPPGERSGVRADQKSEDRNQKSEGRGQKKAVSDQQSAMSEQQSTFSDEHSAVSSKNPLPLGEGRVRAERANVQPRKTMRTPRNSELGTQNFSLIRVQLETGRRNQIRVHFAEAGHPILGDRRYRPDLSAHPRWKAKRLALHAASLQIEHPTTGRLMRFEAPLPQEFEPFVRGKNSKL